MINFMLCEFHLNKLCNFLKSQGKSTFKNCCLENPFLKECYFPKEGTDVHWEQF